MAGFSDWKKTGSVILPQAIDSNSSTEQVKLGTRVTAQHDDYGVAEFIYLNGVASTAQGMAVVYDENYVTALTAAGGDDEGNIAVAMSASVANEYGWYCIYGTVPVEVEASAAADKAVYLGASTAGHLDDNDVAGDMVQGAVTRSALDTPNTGQAWIQLSYPTCNDAADD
tara:strand:- start:51 stop:560 length:510 start_codon:yes stop_codon:yes gene_type:complete